MLEMTCIGISSISFYEWLPMSPIRAFVGHSFTSDDENLVRVFLRYFDDVKALDIGFDWVHAENAEPLDLRDKVLRLAEDKNLFIGICTSKEQAISRKDLARHWLIRTRLSASESSYSTKTSDWIIQEIGFAIGKGMKLLLLVEEGLRQPGGLQGNIEYITFARNAPEKSFGRILQMIQSLLAESDSSSLQSQESPQPKTQNKTDDHGQQDLWTQPQIDWVREDYALALMRAIATKKMELEQRIYEAYLVTPNAKESDNASTWEAERAYWQIVFGDGSSIAVIQRLANDKPQSAEVLKNLGHAYRHFKEHKKAAEIYIDAASRANDAKGRLDMLGYAIPELVVAEEFVQAACVLEQVKKIGQTDETLQSLTLTIIKEYAESTKNDDLYFGVCEKLLEFSPADNELRFSLAYKYSEVQSHELSLFHYSRIPHRGRGAITWNNLGVAYNNLKLKVSAMRAFRKSEADGETLAMSNIASDLLRAGFEPEARAICEKAMALPDHNKRVPTVMVSINETVEHEDKKIEELDKEAQALHAFFAKFGESGARLARDEASGTWKGPRCNLQFTIRNGAIEAVGSYVVQPSGLASLLSGGIGIKESPKTMTVRVTGKMFGLAAICEMKIRESGREELQSGIGLLGDSKLLIAVSNEIDRAFAYEPGAPSGGKFYGLNRPN